MISNKLDLTLSIVLIVIAFTFLYLYGRSYRNQSHKINKDGTQVEGVILERGQSRHPRRPIIYTIKYEFIYKGRKYSGFEEFNSKWYYDHAIVGMKYQVKFLSLANGSISKSSRIYIDKPIESAYVNIQTERERIRNEYYPQRQQIPTAREIEDLYNIIPSQYYILLIK